MYGTESNWIICSVVHIFHFKWIESTDEFHSPQTFVFMGMILTDCSMKDLLIFNPGRGYTRWQCL